MTHSTPAMAPIPDSELTRPIIGIENRTAQEVFDIMADRVRRALRATRPEPAPADGLTLNARIADRGRIAELEQAERNRDMWKGQVERQAEQLTELRAALAAATPEPQP